jgi:putative PIN family toxin of toxin-antitoxin system
MIDAVFDTNIYLQATLSNKGPAFACWQLVENNEVRVFATDAILAEIEDVFNRPKLRRNYPVLTDEKVSEIIKSIYSLAVIIEKPEDIYKFERDENDEVFINLALTVEADFLVSRDNDLLDLAKDKFFLETYPKLKVVNPAEFLQICRTKLN